jgi:hypothetical protein
VLTDQPPSQCQKHDLRRFELSDMIELGTQLRSVHHDAGSMEEAARVIVSCLYEQLVDPSTGTRNCVLVRFFKTHRYDDLEPELQGFARRAAGDPSAVDPDTRCLTLLASAGDLPEWNLRSTSAGHKAIPLISEEVVRQAPMVWALIQQMGLEVKQVIRPEAGLMLDAEQRTFNVFHVPDAVGSPLVPAQDFVRAHQVRSVLGFGGLFPSGDMFSVIMFARVYIPRETAEMFRTLALGIKLAVLPFLRGQVFSREN